MWIEGDVYGWETDVFNVGSVLYVNGEAGIILEGGSNRLSHFIMIRSIRFEIKTTSIGILMRKSSEGYHSQDVVIEKCVFHSGNYNIKVECRVNLWFINNWIEGGGYGIYFEDGVDFWILHNLFWHNNVDLYFFRGNRVLVDGCRSEDSNNFIVASYEYGIKRTIITNNRIFATKNDVISIGKAFYGLIIKNNYLDGENTTPRFLTISSLRTNALVIDNIIENCTESYPISITLGATGIKAIVKRNIGYPTENEGIATIIGDGTTTTFTIDIQHGLVSDKIVVYIACKRSATYKWYLVDTDSDGFYETVRVEITFDSAPADGEVVEIYWKAEVIT